MFLFGRNSRNSLQEKVRIQIPQTVQLTPITTALTFLKISWGTLFSLTQNAGPWLLPKGGSSDVSCRFPGSHPHLSRIWILECPRAPACPQLKLILVMSSPTDNDPAIMQNLYVIEAAYIHIPTTFFCASGRMTLWHIQLCNTACALWDCMNRLNRLRMPVVVLPGYTLRHTHPHYTSVFI